MRLHFSIHVVCTQLLKLAPLAVVVACANPQIARSSAAEKVSTNSSTIDPSPHALDLQSIKASDWSGIEADRIAPDCDARTKPAKADATKLAEAHKIIMAWSDFKKQPKKGPETGEGVKVGHGTPEPTRSVSIFMHSGPKSEVSSIGPGTGWAGVTRWRYQCAV